MAVWKPVLSDNTKPCHRCKSDKFKRYYKRELIVCEKCLTDARVR